MLSTTVITGSMMSGTNQHRLAQVHELLEKIKEFKLRVRHEKNNTERHQGEATFQKIYEHFLEEVRELQEAIDKEDSVNILEEIADCINCLEILVITLGY